MSKFLTAKEVAALFGVKPWAVYNWAKTGRLKAYRIVSVVRFKEEDVLALVKEIKGGKTNESK